MKTFTFQSRGGFVIKMLVHKKSTCQSIVFLLQLSLLLLSCSVPPLSLKPLIRADLSVVWASEQGRWWWCVAVMVCPLSLSLSLSLTLQFRSIPAEIKIQPECISHSLKEKPVQVHLNYY